MFFTAVQVLIIHYHDFLLPQCRCTSISEDGFTSLKTELSHTKDLLRDLAPQVTSVLDVNTVEISISTTYSPAPAPAHTHAAYIDGVVRPFVFLYQASEAILSYIHARVAPDFFTWGGGKEGKGARHVGDRY